MKEFLADDFLLDDELSQELYFNHAHKMPIFDFHCHLLPEQIAHDYHFSTITEAWLGKDGYGDHYKWRLLREYGVKESLITGNGDDYEKFYAFASAMPYFIGNPIYEWCHLELKTYFGITTPLNKKTAKALYEECNEKLKTLSARKMMELNHVETVFTTDDPIDDLRYHKEMKEDTTLKVHVAPCYRPDKALNIQNKDFKDYLGKLSDVVHYPLTSIDSLTKALIERLDFFVSLGCVASDHALNTFSYLSSTKEEADLIFKKALNGDALTFEEETKYRSYLLIELAKAYKERNMVQQYHIGALRDNSSRGYTSLGVDSGYDACGDLPIASSLSRLLDAEDKENHLPKTILYCLNEKDYTSLVTIMNCFQGEEKGKIQLGAAWWFNDCYNGMMTQMKRLSDDGLISCFVGMLTDSRSFLSYPRHDYFRRELCSYLSSLVHQGRYPKDIETLGEIVENISYHNAMNYFFGKKGNEL